MPTKTGNYRPRAGHGLGSQMADKATIKRSRVGSAKTDRNRNRVESSKPAAPARRDKRR